MGLLVYCVHFNAVRNRLPESLMTTNPINLDVSTCISDLVKSPQHVLASQPSTTTCGWDRSPAVLDRDTRVRVSRSRIFIVTARHSHGRALLAHNVASTGVFFGLRVCVRVCVCVWVCLCGLSAYTTCECV